MAKARRTGSQEIRQVYREWLVDLAAQFGHFEPRFRTDLDRLDRGQMFRCHAYEVDLLPADELLQVDAHDTVTVVPPRLSVDSAWLGG